MKRPARVSARPFVEGLAAFLAVFVAAELIRFPPRIAIAAAALAAIAVIYRRPLLAWLLGPGAGRQPPAALAAVLAQSEAELARLKEAQALCGSDAVSGLIGELAEAGDAIVSQAKEGALEPRLGARVLSYYLPRAADIADAWPALEERGDEARLASAQALLQRLLRVFQDAALGQSKEALKTLDVDMRLLDQALEEEAPPRP